MILKKIVGILIVIAAVAGIIFSLVGLVEIWRYRPLVTKTVMDNLVLGDVALSSTQDALTIVDQVVQAPAIDIASLQSTIKAISQAIHDTNPTLDSLISWTGKDFPATINATQTALASAQSSALIVDNVLGALTSIPFLSVTAYNPAVPLHTSLAQVSTSLNTLLPTMAALNTTLAESRTSLGTVDDELTKITDAMQGISGTLSSAQTLLAQYKVIIAQLRANIKSAQLEAPTWILATASILSFFLGWLLIAQLALALQGLDLVRGHRKDQ